MKIFQRFLANHRQPKGIHSYKSLGTAYEVAVHKMLTNSLPGLELDVCGASGDRGIDLRGTWTVFNKDIPPRKMTFKAIVQCKRLGRDKPCPPNIIRELEGAWSAAISDSHSPIISFLACSTEPTQQSLETIKSSRMPLAYLQFCEERERLLFAHLNVSLQLMCPWLTCVEQRIRSGRDVLRLPVLFSSGQKC